MSEHGYVHCRVCGFCVSRRFGVHPTCRPLDRSHQPPAHNQSLEENDEGDVAMHGGPSLPPLKDVMGHRSPVLKHIPKSCRHVWAQVLTRAIAKVCAHNSVEAWTEFCMLPKAVLLPPPRKGKKHIHKTAAFVSDRLSRWEAGERASLWEELPTPKSKPGRKMAQEQRLKHAVSLCREGFDRKACAALISDEICEESIETVNLLKPLHPQAPPPNSAPMSDLPWCREITPGTLSKVLKSFPLDSAPGPSGLRIQHLLEALTTSHSGALTEQLAQMVELLAQGSAPEELATHLAGAKLLALKKPKGGVRPVAIGEVMRRIVGKCLCATIKEEAQEFFEPLQVGVACKLGVDAAVHTCRKWANLHKHSQNKVMLKIDFSNAFNTISRESVLSKVRTTFPELARWVTWCYAKPSNLLFGGHTLSSTTGVQQGDPLGPLLFSLAIHDTVKELSIIATPSASTLDLTTFYLDDGVLAGDAEVVADALRLLEARCSSLGLVLNHGKSELILPGADTSADLSSLFPHDLLCDAETGESRVLLNGNFEMLGASVGDADFCTAYTQGKTKKAAKLLDQIANIEDPQVATRLLRNCAGVCKITHNMRMVPAHLHRPALREFDQKVHSTFCTSTGLLPDNEQWAQAGRGFKFAGLGLRSAELHGEAAYLASACGSREKCHRLLATFALNAEDASSDVGINLAAYNAKLPPDKGLQAGDLANRTQKALSEALDAAGHTKRLQEACATDRATLISECQKGAKEFFQAIPSKVLGLDVPAAEFVVEMRHRLCMKERPEDDWCPLCDQVLDTRGLHARTCCAGGDRTRRHNKTRNKGLSFAKRAGCNPELEKGDLLLPPRPDDTSSNRRRPADVYLPTWTHGLPAALDFAITAPQRQGIVDRAAANALAAATEYCSTKRSFENTQAECEAAGVTFVAMVAETTGAWAPESLAVWKQLASAVAIREGKDKDKVLTEMLQSLSVTIRRANAQAFLRRSGV